VFGDKNSLFFGKKYREKGLTGQEKSTAKYSDNRVSSVTYSRKCIFSKKLTDCDRICQSYMLRCDYLKHEEGGIRNIK